MMKALTTAFLTILSLTSASPLALTPRADPVCPADGYLPADQSQWLFPVLITPVSAANPDTKYGTVYSPKITPGDFCTIYNLYVPESAAGKTCTLKFFFPRQDQLRTSSFTYDGPGHFTFTGYAFGSGADADTTWNNQPPAGPSKLQSHEERESNADEKFELQARLLRLRCWSRAMRTSLTRVIAAFRLVRARSRLAACCAAPTPRLSTSRTRTCARLGSMSLSAKRVDRLKGVLTRWLPWM